MKITFDRKKAFPLFFAEVDISVDGEKIASLKNGWNYTHIGPAKIIKLHGPGVVRSIEFEIEPTPEEITVEFKIAMGFMAAGFKVLIMHNGELRKKIRRTF